MIWPARRYLLSEVPSGSLPALLATGAALALQRLVLPAVHHWMTDIRHILRPRTPGNGTAHDAGMIADSIVNLCGAIGWRGHGHALPARSQEPADPTPSGRARHHRVAVPGTRHGVVERQRVLDNLSMIPAALIPLGALLVTEGICGVMPRARPRSSF